MFDFYIQEDSRLYGIDWDGPIPYNENEITVPQTFCPLNERNVQELMDTILPSAPCSDYGIDLYTSTVSFILQKIN